MVRKYVGMALVLGTALLVAVGCSKSDKSNPVSPNDTNVLGGDLTSQQQQSMAENFFAFNAVSAMDQAGMAGAALMDRNFFIGGLGPMPQGFGGHGIPRIATPPENWTGPDGDGWYLYTFDTPSEMYNIYLRWTPDIWADTTLAPNKIELRFEYSDTTDTSQIDFTTSYSFWSQLTDNGTKIDGGSNWESSFAFTADSTIAFSWDFNWTGVTVDPGDYAGSYTSEGDYPVLVPETQRMVLATTASSFDFISDGSGTGNASIGGQEFIRFNFDPYDESTMLHTGNYYLLSENWAIPHPFSI